LGELKGRPASNEQRGERKWTDPSKTRDADVSDASDEMPDVTLFVRKVAQSRVDGWA